MKPLRGIMKKGSSEKLNCWCSSVGRAGIRNAQVFGYI